MIKTQIDKIINDYKTAKNKSKFLVVNSKIIALKVLGYFLFLMGLFSYLIFDRNNFNDFLQQHKTTKNKSVFLLNNRKKIFIGLVSTAALLGFLGYIISPKTSGFFNVINSTIALFFGEFKDDDNLLLDIAKTLAIGSVFSGAMFLFFSNRVNDWIVKNVQKKPFDLVIGLSSQNQYFINSLKHVDSTLIIEADATHKSVEEYRKKGFGIISSKAEEAIDKLDHLENLKNCIISTGNDRQNITLGLRLMDKMASIDEQPVTLVCPENENPYPLSEMPNEDDAQVPKDHRRTVYVRIDNRDFSVLLKEEAEYVISQHKKGIDIIPFSIHTIISRQLFSEHSILGLQPEIIKSNQSFNIILVGASKLVSELIYHLSILAHLPEQNRLTIYCIDQEAQLFCDNIDKRFPGISEIPQLTLKPLELNNDGLDFYKDSVWKTSNLTNIIIATEDEDRNLDIAVHLQDTTYIKETTTEGLFRTKVLFAIYNHAGLGEKIDTNKKAFANFFSFADLSKASSKENLIDEDLDIIAKLSHYHGYKEFGLSTEEKVDENALYREWMELSLHKRESNRAQAIHIDIKLLSLKLKKVKSDKAFKYLLEFNQEIFDKSLLDKSCDKDKINDYFPSSFENLIDKIARAEHNRWNAFHYLRGWKYDSIRIDASKQHNCLVPLEKFEDEDQKSTYKYDLLSIYNIPLYLTHAEYEIIPIEFSN